MIRSLDDVTEFPICWPDNKPRSAQRQASLFHTKAAAAFKEIEIEMRRWRAGHRYIISMAPQHRQGQVDPGVALWWNMPPIRGDNTSPLRVLACDQYLLREANLHAIALTLTGLRAFERYGTYTVEQAVEGARLALPPPAEDAIDWPLILGVERTWPLAAIEAVWKTKVEKAHPDRGGDPAVMASLNAAMDAARKEARK